MKEGDIVKYDFEVYADDALIDTTIQDLAKEHEIEVEEGDYTPRFAISGMDAPYPGLKDAILLAEEGGNAEFEVAPKDAFGERNPRNLDYRRYADIARIAQQQEKEVDRGVKLEIDGRIAVITLVTPGRVRIDYNHEFAGKTIKSKITIISVLKEKEDIINAILEMSGGSSSEFDFSEEEEGILSIKVPSGISLGMDWGTVKLRVVTLLRKHTGIKNIRYIEEFFQKTDLKKDSEEGGEGEIPDEEIVGTGEDETEVTVSTDQDNVQEDEEKVSEETESDAATEESKEE